ncbi:hypothetical protein LTR53_020510, partial [Teratosphaeriaceae sp. CCFEE 6253]
MQIPEAPTPSEPNVNPALLPPAGYQKAAAMIKSPKQAPSAVPGPPETTIAATPPAKSEPAATPATAPAAVGPDVMASLTKQFDSLYQ